MPEQGVVMWILVARENFEEPVVASRLDAESFSARRRTILVFFDPGVGSRSIGSPSAATAWVICSRRPGRLKRSLNNGAGSLKSSLNAIRTRFRSSHRNSPHMLLA
tara:strand:+ start:10048 stop:10365 length:318 start_codon:yes stop_codon:yes gene_type:complete